MTGKQLQNNSTFDLEMNKKRTANLE